MPTMAIPFIRRASPLAISPGLSYKDTPGLRVAEKVSSFPTLRQGTGVGNGCWVGQSTVGHLLCAHGISQKLTHSLSSQQLGKYYAARQGSRRSERKSNSNIGNSNYDLQTLVQHTPSAGYSLGYFTFILLLVPTTPSQDSVRRPVLQVRG